MIMGKGVLEAAGHACRGRGLCRLMTDADQASDPARAARRRFRRDPEAKNRILDLLPMLGALLAVTGALTWGDLWAQRHFGLIDRGAATFHNAVRPEPWRRVLDFTADRLPGARQGLVVTSVRSNGYAEHAGLAVGDRIARADGREPGSLQSLAEELSLRGQRPMHLDVVHQGEVRRIELAGEPQRPRTP
ncbi:PDZ domain-containing protein [Novosphingobium sp. PhB165]|nr:PDZ domain-containing protein [Novosphingobium sp. PhB165]